MTMCFVAAIYCFQNLVKLVLGGIVKGPFEIIGNPRKDGYHELSHFSQPARGINNINDGSQLTEKTTFYEIRSEPSNFTRVISNKLLYNHLFFSLRYAGKPYPI